MKNGVITFCLAVTVFAVASCGSDSILEPQEIAGTYVLETVTGSDETPTYGMLRLEQGGEVERRIGVAGEEFVWAGRFRVRGATLELALWPAGTVEDSPHYSPVEYRNGVIVLRYGHPSDGPDVTEVYHRAGAD